METIIKEVEWEGTFKGFLDDLRSNPKFYYETSEELFEAYLATSKRIDPELVNIFKENNVDYYKPTVFMCGSGISACVLGLAYFLISDKNAVIYDGSFAEWGKK